MDYKFASAKDMSRQELYYSSTLFLEEITLSTDCLLLRFDAVQIIAPFDRVEDSFVINPAGERSLIPIRFIERHDEWIAAVFVQLHHAVIIFFRRRVEADQDVESHLIRLNSGIQHALNAGIYQLFILKPAPGEMHLPFGEVVVPESDRSPRGATSITTALALEWAQQPSSAQPVTWAQRLSQVRGFARYRSATDSQTEIPPSSLLPFRPKRARPYLYTDQEIEQLLNAALNLPPADGLRRWIYHALLGLVEMLLRWYRAGEDVERRLPILSTYLGHVHVSDTYWYLTACPELMGLAVKRLEHRWEVQS